MAKFLITTIKQDKVSYDSFETDKEIKTTPWQELGICVINPEGLSGYFQKCEEVSDWTGSGFFKTSV